MDAQELFDRYRQEYYSLFNRMVGDIVLCNCETCKQHPRTIRVDALGQALVDALSQHIFAVAAANVEMGEETMLEARRKSVENINKFFTEFGHERTGQASSVG